MWKIHAWNRYFYLQINCTWGEGLWESRTYRSTGNSLGLWCCCCCQVTSVVSNSVRPHRWQPARLPRPWDSPGKNTGVGCHFLLQCMKVKSESEVPQSCPTLCDPMDCSLPGSSVHGIFQARVLEWVLSLVMYIPFFFLYFMTFMCLKQHWGAVVKLKLSILFCLKVFNLFCKTQPWVIIKDIVDFRMRTKQEQEVSEWQSMLTY